MNRLLKLFALVLTLAMALSAVAIAEEPAPDSTIYTLALMDPIVTCNGETLVDLTGLDLELAAALTDAGVLGLLLNVYAGENLDLITGAEMQFDANGFSLLLNGMSNLYGFTAEDLDAMTGVENYIETLTSIPMRTLAKTESETESFDFSAEQRFALIREVFSGLDVPADAQGEVVHSFHFDRERASELLSQIAAAMDASGADPDVSFSDELNASGATFEISGTVTATPGDGESGLGSAVIDAEGTVLFDAEEDNMPFTVRYVDDGSTVDCDVVLDPDGEAIALTFDLASVAGSREVDLSAGMTIPSESVVIGLDAELNNNGDDTGFACSLSYADDVDSGSFSVSYAGAMTGEGADRYHAGRLTLGMTADGESYEFATNVAVTSQDISMDAWALDSSAMVDLNAMDEDALNTVSTNVALQLVSALNDLQEQVPGLAALLGTDQPAATAEPSDGYAA